MFSSITWKSLPTLFSLLLFLLVICGRAQGGTTRRLDELVHRNAERERAMLKDVSGSATAEEEDPTLHRYSEFTVAGVNLALYDPESQAADVSTKEEPPFSLYQDFDIAALLQGNETWQDMIAIRASLERPSLSFYVDKVARKRWLPSQGYDIPRVFALHYGEELTLSSSEKNQNEEELFLAVADKIEEFLPKDFCAKPTHMSLTHGNWIISYDRTSGETRFTNQAKRLVQHEEFRTRHVAESLADSLSSPPADHESWALKNVKPGIVIEERFTDTEDDDSPPEEVTLFTIWGRVWVAQWSFVYKQYRLSAGFVHRNGTMVHGSKWMEEIPSYLNWLKLVEIAETLGAHKDMFRTDILIGVPASSKSMREGASGEERTGVIRRVVSESEIYPTTEFHHTSLADEGARLWVAGYKTGNYKLIPNNEVPEEFIETGKLSAVSTKIESDEL